MDVTGTHARCAGPTLCLVCYLVRQPALPVGLFSCGDSASLWGLPGPKTQVQIQTHPHLQGTPGDSLPFLSTELGWLSPPQCWHPQEDHQVLPLRTLRREAVRPPLIWSDEAPGAVWAPPPLGSRMGSRSRSSGIQIRACNGNTGDGVPGRCRARQRRSPWGGCAGPRRLPRISTWLWGSDLWGAGSVCCSLLRVLSVSGKRLEMPHRSKYI